MNIGVILSNEFSPYLKDITKLISSLGHKPLILKSSKDLIINCQKLVGGIQSKKIDKAFVIDDYGTLPFMYIAKHQGIVVAQISDEHSAYMTHAHNNATVLTFGGKVSTLPQIKNMITTFLNTKYEGGRHEVRLGMLDTLLEHE